MLSRRHFLATTAAASAGAVLAPRLFAADDPKPQPAEVKVAFGLVTYMWGADWDLPTLIANCEKTEVRGVELRTTHKHGVEPELNEKAREEVQKRFADAGVVLVGLGSNESFDHVEPAKLAAAIERSKQFLRLSHDIGGTGVKVKPNDFHSGVDKQKTIDQIGAALNTLGEYAEGFGQQVRLEVHGQCAELPTIAAIMKVAEHPSVAVCWNSNPTDLNGDGLAANFKLVAPRLGHTVHIHELENEKYPYEQLFKLLLAADYAGWALLEASTKPEDRVAALKQQRELFEKLVAKAAK